MGDPGKGALRVKFDRELELIFHGTTVTSDPDSFTVVILDGALI